MSTNLRRNQKPGIAPGFGGTLGVIALAFGIGVLGAYALDLHSHTCESCGYKWRHLGAFNLGDAASHTCGTVQWWKCGFMKSTTRDMHSMPAQPPAIAQSPRLALSDGGEPTTSLDQQLERRFR
jgi:hypothetical protein